MNKNNKDTELNMDTLSNMLNKTPDGKVIATDDFFNDDVVAAAAPAGAADLNNKDKSDNPNAKNIEPEDLIKELSKGIKLGGANIKDDKEVEINNSDDKDDDKSDLKDNKDTEAVDLSEYEEDISNFFTEKFSEELSWELSEEEKPKSVADVVNLIKKVVEENSTPSYSDDRVKALDEFIANGGKFEDFYKVATNDSIPLDTADLENELHQKALLREDLRNSGYNDSTIDKKIQRWETAGVLQDEAEEALDRVKEFREKNQQKLLDDQKKQKQDYDKAQQKFFSSVDKITKETTNILGVDISDKNKKDLLEYVFRPESDGYTKFYKETGLVVTPNTNPKYLLETAYIAKNGNTIVKNIEKKVESQAAKNLKEKLSYNKGPRGINQTADRDNSFNISSLGSQLLPRN